jgi:hypothetical protein
MFANALFEQQSKYRANIVCRECCWEKVVFKCRPVFVMAVRLKSLFATTAN